MRDCYTPGWYGVLLAFFMSPSGIAAPVAPSGIMVLQGGVNLGVVKPYVGDLAAVPNYNYIQPSGFPINGPAPEAFEGRIFFYEGTDGLHLNVIFNEEGIGNGTAKWLISVTDSVSDPIVQFSDDPAPPEDAPNLVELSDNVFAGDWSWTGRVDGGVIGPLVGNQWSITIDQLEYGSTNDRGISRLFAYGPEGLPFELNLFSSPAGQIMFRPIAVPEPTLLVLAFTAAMSMSCGA